jgi:hypothetical protein
MESQAFDTSGKVCNIRNANYLLMCALDAEGKQINTLTGMLFSLTRQIFMFAITFAYPLLYGRAVYNHKITSTDGDSNEYSAVDFAARMAAVAKAAAAGGPAASGDSDAGDTAQKAKIKGHTRLDQFGRRHIYSKAECQWVCVVEPDVTATNASVSMENAIALGHLGGHDHRSARDYFHAVIMTWKNATKHLTGYDKAMAATALDWVKRICYDAATPNAVAQELDEMVEWLQDPDRKIPHRRLTQHKVPLPLEGKTIRDPEFKVLPTTMAATKTTFAIPTRIYNFKPTKHTVCISWEGACSSEDDINVTLASAGLLQYVGYAKLRECYEGAHKDKLPLPLALPDPEEGGVGENGDVTYKIGKIVSWCATNPSCITVFYDGFIRLDAYILAVVTGSWAHGAVCVGSLTAP